jgi:hypothetical protein
MGNKAMAVWGGKTMAAVASWGSKGMAVPLHLDLSAVNGHHHTRQGATLQRFVRLQP